MKISGRNMNDNLAASVFPGIVLADCCLPTQHTFSEKIHFRIESFLEFLFRYLFRLASKPWLVIDIEYWIGMPIFYGYLIYIRTICPITVKIISFINPVFISGPFIFFEFKPSENKQFRCWKCRQARESSLLLLICSL